MNFLSNCTVKKKSRIFGIFAIVAVIVASSVLFSACGQKPSLSGAKVTEDVKFKAAIVDISIDDFNKLGFSLGDSCNVKFSNGYELKDVPYFDGYYVQNGAPVIVAYPSNEYVTITLNNVGIWETAGLNDGCTVDITLNKTKKYSATQEALGQRYSLLREEYSSDEEFANFRAISGGSLKKNFIFRGASPVDNSRNRAGYTDNLLKSNGIACIIDLADSKANLESYFAGEDFSSEYAKSLYESGNMVLLSMSSGYTSDAYKESVVRGLEFMLEHGGPYYIHCMEGKDRTGFVCALIEALCGASYDEMRDDYMKTYENYYKISAEKTPEKYNAVVELYFDSFMRCISGKDDLSQVTSDDYVSGAKRYLTEGSMSSEDIDRFIALITE